MRDPHVLIIGAGIGGLATALALQKSGLRVSVFEAASELGEVGAGLTIASNGSIILQHLGLGPVLEEFACVPECGAVLHYRDGRRLVETRQGEQTTRMHGGAPYCQIHRADLHDGLRNAVLDNDRECIHLGHAFSDLEDSGTEITAHFSGHPSASGDLLIGCDGIRSTVRARLFGQGDPRFTGFVAWRGIVPMSRLPEGLIDPDTAVVKGPGRYITRYKMRAGELLNYAAISRTDAWTEEGWSVPSSVDAVCREFADFNESVRTFLAATPADACYRWGIFDRRPLERWSVGRATLLGDAAHPMTPFLGQGGVMALEDAIIIVRCLLESASIETAFARYQAARMQRVELVFKESRNAGEVLTTFDPDTYSPARHQNEETLGLADYNAVTAPI